MPILECAGGCGTMLGTATVGTVEMLCSRCATTTTLAPSSFELGPDADSRRAGAAVNNWVALHYGAGSSSTTHAPVLRYGEPTGRWAATSTRWRHAQVPTVGVPMPEPSWPAPADDTRPTVTVHVCRYQAPIAPVVALDHDRRTMRALVWRETFELAFEAAHLDERRRSGHRAYAQDAADAAAARWDAEAPQAHTAGTAAHWWSTVTTLHAGMLRAPKDDGGALEAKRALLLEQHLMDELVWELIEAQRIDGVVLQRRAAGLRTSRKPKAPKGPRRKRQVVGPDENGQMDEEVNA